MITTVSATEQNTTDTTNTTNNIEVNTNNIEQTNIEEKSTTLNTANHTQSLKDNPNPTQNTTDQSDNTYNDPKDENNEIQKENSKLKSNSQNLIETRSNQEILGASNDNDILGVIQSFSASGDISQITVSVTYSFSISDNSVILISVSCDGKSNYLQLYKPLGGGTRTGSVNIPGPFTPGIKTISITDQYGVGYDTTCTINKTSPTGISASISSSYNYGSSGTYSYSGSVNGQGSESMEGTVYIYKDGSNWTSTTCDSSGRFSTSWSSTDLSAGNHTFTCYYAGNDYYNSYGSSSSLQGSKSITVSKGTPQITSTRTINTDTYPGKVTVTFTVKNQKGNTLSGITLTPNGNKFSSSASSTDSNGKVNFTVTPLDAGSYSDWTVSTTETSNYKSVTSSAVSSFTINKQVPTVTYTIENIDNVYPGGKKINLQVKDSKGYWLDGFTVLATGSGFTSSNKETDNVGAASFTMCNLTAGTYSDWKFTVSPSSDEDKNNFAVKEVTVTSFTIKPYNVTVNIDNVLTPSVSVYESTVVLKGNVTYPDNAPSYPNGKVYAQLGDITSYGIVKSDGTFTIEFVGVKPGEYYQLNDVYFSPDSTEKNYVSSTKEMLNIKRVLIYQGDSYISDLMVTAKDNNFTYGNRITVSGSVKGNGRSPTGNVTLYIDGNLNKIYGKYSIVSDGDGQFQFVLSNAPAGNHYFTVVYDGDEYYYDSTNNTGQFSVGPADMNFESIRVVNGYYNGAGSSAYFNVTVSANGEGDIPRGQIRVNLSDNSRSWTASLNGNNSIVYITNLVAGTYSDVSVEYIPAGDEKNYNSRIAQDSYSFEVFKGAPDFTIDAPSVGLGENAFIYINLPSDAKGIVTLTVRENTYTFNLNDNPNNRTLKMIEPPAGQYKITARYSGDDNWKGHDDGLDDFNTTLYVERPGANIKIDVSDISYGENATINLSVYSKGVFQSKARGTVTVYGLNDEGYVVDIIEGKGVLTVPHLAMGSYSIVAYYSGYNDLMGNINTLSFKVNGINTNMRLSLNSSSIDKGSSILLTVSVAEDIFDPIYLYVDGQRVGVSVANNGVATFIISSQTLTTGNHNITTTLLSNEKYNGISNNTTFIVNKIVPNYSVGVVADSNKNIIFTIFIGEGASGRITINGNGTTKKTLVDEGYAEYTLTGLTPGYYTYNITYSGDDNYQEFTTLRSVNSNKLSDYTMTITNTEAASGKSPIVYVNLPNQLNGEKVYLYINNNPTPLESTIVDGIATFNSASITPIEGKIFVRAVFEGNDNYDVKNVNKTINVDKISQYDLNINIPKVIYVGDDVSVKITCPDDINKVNITINGLNKGEFNPTTGYIIRDIDEGTYNILVSYRGDNVYYPKESNITFTSIKRTPSLNVSVDSVSYGNPVIIGINITDKTSGIILVTLDDAEYKYLDITSINHKIIIQDSNINVGNHNLSVSYMGDRIYNSVKSDIYRFSIDKNNTYSFDAKVNENNIVNGGSVTRNDEDTFLFEVDLPDDATGNVSVIIKKSNSVVVNKIINLPNNMISIPINNFGEYNVNLTYNGDGNYDARSIIFTLISTSNKVITNFGFDTAKTGVLYANISQSLMINSTNYDGPVEFYIDGVYFKNTTISGHSGSIMLPSLAQGNHLFTLKFNGNDNYNSFTFEKSFNLIKKYSNVKIDINEGHVSELTNISVSVIDDNDNLLRDAEGYVFINISGETQLIEVKNGKAILNITYMLNGTHNIDVVYRGDSRYNESRSSNSFTINKFDSSVSVEKTTLMFNETLIIKVNYTDASGQIKITFDGETKTLNVSNGVAYLTDLPDVSKIYEAVVEYLGDYKYSSYNSIIPITIVLDIKYL